MKYKVILIEVGRSKVNKTLTINAVELEDAEILAERECRKYLMSNEVQVKPSGQFSKNWGMYNVYAGFRIVGKVKIEKQGEKLI